jgi:AcrR family transcriptional regulator
VIALADNSQYITMDEAANKLGVTRATLYYYIRSLQLEKHKFPLDKRVYLSLADFEQIKLLKDQAAERRSL